MSSHHGAITVKSTKEIDPDLPILFCSGYSEGDLSFNQGQGEQPDGFIKKPVGLSDMKRNLERILL